MYLRPEVREEMYLRPTGGSGRDVSSTDRRFGKSGRRIAAMYW